MFADWASAWYAPWVAPGVVGSGGTPGGGAIAEDVGDLFWPLELRRGVGSMTPHDAVALSPQGMTVSLPTGAAWVGVAVPAGEAPTGAPRPTKRLWAGASAPPAPQTTPPAVIGVGAAAVLQSTWTLPLLLGMWLPLLRFLLRLPLLF